MNNTIEDINEKALYILKLNEEGRFETGFFKINDDLINELEVEKLYKFIDTEYPTENEDALKLQEEKQEAVIELFKIIYEKYEYLYSHRSYCSRQALTSSYCEFKRILSPDDVKKTDSFERDELRISLPFVNTWAKNYINQFLYSYFLEQAYNECMAVPAIKVFSHRKVGWKGFEYKLNDIMSVDISTNFSFGSASYFVLTLIYDDILIIPYSRLVIYYFAKTSQLIRHTIECNVDDRSWSYALNFIKDACNELIDNGANSFIAKYMIVECEKLTEILPSFLEQNEFYLSDNFRSYTGVEIKSNTHTLNNIDLMIFRGEKIAGAVNYTENIKKMNKLFPTDKYINTINECCKKIKPMLYDEIIKQDGVLIELNQKYNYLNEILEKCNEELVPIDVKIVEFNKIKEEKRDQIFNSPVENKEGHYKYSTIIMDLVDEYMKANYVDYDITNEIKSKLDKHRLDTDNEINKVYREKYKLQNDIATLNKHNDRISSYLNNL